jgi:hypothetical protein
MKGQVRLHFEEKDDDDDDDNNNVSFERKLPKRMI